MLFAPNVMAKAFLQSLDQPKLRQRLALSYGV
jgi:hypothetical protein